ncbi:histidine kinase [Alsobacter soli]|uniref:Histidine kinase n=1 Tax=Alsobacter soli TaxID=2109933 RepID=A0A2T1HZA4_9HYPH|nr:histidine kinase [Alsobacter soli]PSC06944.1 histidine kinase [Alsobacter soli]
MADYYPLISRAVANLAESTPEQRRALYERATNALIGQLRNTEPPIAEADIDRERVALEDAIRRVETEYGGGVPATSDIFEPSVPPRPAEQAARPVQQTTAHRPAAEPEPEHEAEPAPSPEPAYEFADEPAPVERLRPAAPRAATGDRRLWVRGAVIGSAIAVVVGLTAATAIYLKQQPSEFAPAKQTAENAPADQERKFQERLPGEGPAQPAEPAQPQSGQQGQAPAGASAAIGVLQRVLLVEEAAEGSTEIKQTVGRVLWRLDSVPAGAGEPLDVAVRADVDVADAGLKADVLIRRNRDAALPASHTIEVRFTAGPKATNGAVRDLGVPEMRTEETTRGTPLAGISVPVTENVFLVGLSNLPADTNRNLELMRQRNWFMTPLRFANGRRALLLFEKGPTGDRTISDALSSWQQGQ